MNTTMTLQNLLIKILWDEVCGLLHLQTNIAAVNLDCQQRSITRETPGLHQLQCDLEALNKV